MNAPHLHLLVNHFPVILPIVAVFLMLAGSLMKKDLLKRTAYALLIGAALFSFGAMATGDEAEHAIEHLSGISHDRIENHEESAESFAVIMYIIGAIAAIAMWWNYKKKPYYDIMHVLILLLTIVSLYFAQQTGTSGGEIRHPEIRSVN